MVSSVNFNPFISIPTDYRGLYVLDNGTQLYEEIGRTTKEQLAIKRLYDDYHSFLLSGFPDTIFTSGAVGTDLSLARKYSELACNEDGFPIIFYMYNGLVTSLDFYNVSPKEILLTI